MRGTKELFAGFDGGVNYQDAPYLLQTNEARDLRNVVGSTRGKINKRNGTTVFSTISGMTKLGTLFAAQNPNILIAVGLVSGVGNIHSITSGGVATSLRGSLGDPFDERWEFVAAPDAGTTKLWGMNGLNTPVVITDGSPPTIADWTASAGTLHNANYLIYASNRAFLANSTSFRSRVWTSQLASMRNYSQTNSASYQVDFDANDGEEITALTSVGPFVAVFKPKKMWIIYDLDRGSNRRVGVNVGCIAHRSAIETPNGLLFLSEDQGVMRTDGFSIERISDNINPLLNTINQSLRQYATAVYKDDHYYLSVPLGANTTNSLVFDYDLRTESWWVHTNTCNDYAVWTIDSTPTLLGARTGGTAGNVDKLYQPGALDDAGSAFSAYWSGPAHTFGAPYTRKRVHQIHVDGDGRLQLSLAKDFNRTSTLMEDETLSDLTYEVREARILTPGVGRSFSLTVGNTTAEDFTLQSYTMGYRMREK